MLFENFIDDIAGLLDCLGMSCVTIRDDNGWASFA